MKTWIKTNLDQNKFGPEQICIGTSLQQHRFTAGFIETTMRTRYTVQVFTRTKLSRGPGLGTLDGLLPATAPVCTLASVHLRLEAHVAFAFGAQRIGAGPEAGR
jgi:hypothetical protein